GRVVAHDRHQVAPVNLGHGRGARLVEAVGGVGAAVQLGGQLDRVVGPRDVVEVDGGVGAALQRHGREVSENPQTAGVLVAGGDDVGIEVGRVVVLPRVEIVSPRADDVAL